MESRRKLHQSLVQAGAKDGPGRGVHVSLADVQARPYTGLQDAQFDSEA